MAGRPSDQWLAPEALETTVALTGNVTLNTSSAFIGLVTVVMGASRVTTAGEDITNDVLKIEQQFKFTSFTSISTVLVKSRSGFVHLINIGKASCPTTYLYDALTPGGATIIHTIGPNYPMGSHLFDIKFNTGLSIDTSATGGDITPQILVAWR